MEDEIRDKKDREIGEPIKSGGIEPAEAVPDFEDGALDTPDLDMDHVQPHEGCPTCGNEDIQNAELLEAWKEIEDLKVKLVKAEAFLPVVPVEASVDAAKTIDVDWKHRYNKIKDAYVKTRLEVSGSFGNWDYVTRKRVLENEISKELGFEV